MTTVLWQGKLAAISGFAHPGWWKYDFNVCQNGCCTVAHRFVDIFVSWIQKDPSQTQSSNDRLVELSKCVLFFLTLCPWMYIWGGGAHHAFWYPSRVVQLISILAFFVWFRLLLLLITFERVTWICFQGGFVDPFYHKVHEKEITIGRNMFGALFSMHRKGWKSKCTGHSCSTYPHHDLPPNKITGLHKAILSKSQQVEIADQLCQWCCRQLSVFSTCWDKYPRLKRNITNLS